jgi:hypothetical protein
MVTACPVSRSVQEVECVACIVVVASSVGRDWKSDGRERMQVSVSNGYECLSYYKSFY